MNYINAADLALGDKFMEDCFPEIYQVMEEHYQQIDRNGSSITGCLAKVVDYIPNTPESYKDWPKLTIFFGGIGAYAPRIIKL